MKARLPASLWLCRRRRAGRLCGNCWRRRGIPSFLFFAKGWNTRAAGDLTFPTLSFGKDGGCVTVLFFASCEGLLRNKSHLRCGSFDCAPFDRFAQDDPSKAHTSADSRMTSRKHEPVVRVQTVSPPQGHGLFEAECQECLCGNYDLPVACEGSPGRACAGPGQAADQRTFATACESTYQGAETSAAPDKSSGALAFAFLGAFDRAGCDRVGIAVGAHGIQTNREFGGALKAAERVCRNNGPAGGRSRGNHSDSVHHHRIHNGRAEALTRLADF